MRRGKPSGWTNSVIPAASRHRSRYDPGPDTGAGKPCISVYFHLVTDEPRDEWKHVMVGDDDAWDTGLVVSCRFVSFTEADNLLSSSGYRQGEFPHFLGEEPT
ncbi:hypothetical protein [Actinoplanes sp. NPDC026619]|uniref:hypothetical protein n=1 Tax=Actinoplanes sp. NPDC026619 TaxID=3155798 RepID=UPI00340E0EBB